MEKNQLFYRPGFGPMAKRKRRGMALNAVCVILDVKRKTFAPD